MAKSTQTYAENYKILEDAYNQLQSNQNNPAVIDELADLLEKTSKAFKVCKERIDASQKYLEQFNDGQA